MNAFNTMMKTELKLSLRGLDMVIFAIFMPVLVIVILGMIYGNKLAYDGASYTFLSQSFAAVAAIAICASGVMGLPLTLADYRNRNILKRMQVTPVSATLILIVQVVVNLLYSLVSLALIYAVAVFFFGYHMDGSLLEFMGSFLLVILSIYSLGLMVAGTAPNIKTANLLCCILYFPMLLFSGATIPYEVMPGALQKAADVMPLTQGIKLMKITSLGLSDSTLLPIIVLISIAIICTVISIKFFRWE